MRRKISEQELEWEAKRGAKFNMIAFGITLFLAAITIVIFLIYK